MDENRHKIQDPGRVTYGGKPTYDRVVMCVVME